MTDKPCVRCGDPAEEDNVYCRDCANFAPKPGRDSQLQRLNSDLDPAEREARRRIRRIIAQLGAAHELIGVPGGRIDAQTYMYDSENELVDAIQALEREAS